jgi:hypothetical protein
VDFVALANDITLLHVSHSLLWCARESSRLWMLGLWARIFWWDLSEMLGKEVVILPTVSETVALQQLSFTFIFIPKHPCICPPLKLCLIFQPNNFDTLQPLRLKAFLNVPRYTIYKNVIHQRSNTTPDVSMVYTVECLSNIMIAEY